MHPAFSIIFFTAISGLGYGLAAMLGLGQLDPSRWVTSVAHVVALALIGAGLLSSLLHLGNPQRAWRAFSQWRSSWLSREGVLAVLTFAPLTVSAGLSLFYGDFVLWLGLAGAALSAVTVFSTSMIYASLKSVDGWHTPLTPACYLLFASASGSMAATLVACAGGGNPRVFGTAAFVLIVAAWVAKWFWRRQLVGTGPTSTPESATGLGNLGAVRLIDPPHMNDNYLTREMGFRIARKHASKLWVIALVAGCAVPLVILAGLWAAGTGEGLVSSLAAGMALIALMAGIFIERWLFFAEARHAVMNYY